jgi:plasmid stabilization system protein ParE
VATIVYAPNALANLERAFNHLREDDPEAARSAAAAIREAVDLLAHHPFVGRALEGELRELVISFGRTGYVALYRFVPARDQVRILAVRHQRELGYPIP